MKEIGFRKYKDSGNLIIICAGDNSYHYKEDWYNEKRNYVLCVVYYGMDMEVLEKYKENCDIFFHCIGLKWHLIQEVLESGKWWQLFNHVAFPDDDLSFEMIREIPAYEQLNKLFAVGKDNNFSLWQPALNGLNTVHKILEVKRKCKYRYVNFIEIMTTFLQ